MLISASNIIKKTINLYRENFKVIFPYLLMLFATTGVMTTLQSVTGNLGIVTLFYGYGLFTLLYFALVIASFVLTIWFSIGLVKKKKKIYNNEKPADTKTELHGGTHLIIPAFLVSLLIIVIIVVGLAPGLITSLFIKKMITISVVSISLNSIITLAFWFFYSFFVMVLLSFSYYAIVIDEHKVIQSMKTSSKLVIHRWWRTLWRLFAPAFVFAVLLAIVQGIINIPTDIIFGHLQTGTPLHIFLLALFSLISALVGVFFTPLTTIPTVILYEELKKTPDTKIEKKSKDEIPAELPKL